MRANLHHPIILPAFIKIPAAESRSNSVVWLPWHRTDIREPGEQDGATNSPVVQFSVFYYNPRLFPNPPRRLDFERDEPMNRSRLACFKHMALALLALVLILCAAEVGLRVYVSNRAGQLPADAPGDSLIVRSWLTHHGLKPLASAACRNPDTGETVVVSTNSYALRGPEPVVPKPLGVFRVLCLGDETTLGADVELSQTFCHRLEELLQPHCRLKLEVINAGVPGYCPLLSYLHVRHSLLALQPDLIVLNFDMGDIWDDYRYRRHTNMNPSGEPLACPNPALIKTAASRQPSVADQFLVVRWGQSQLAGLPITEKRAEDRQRIDSALARYAWIADNPPDWSIHTKQALAPIDRLNQLTARNFTRLAVAVYPAPWQVAANATNGGNVRQAAGIENEAVFRSRAPFDQLQQYAQEHGIAFHDASPVFQTAQQPEQSFLTNAARFSPTGHNIYARELARFIYRTVPDIWNTSESSPTQTEPTRNARSARR